jgi:hypothetical protein
MKGKKMSETEEKKQQAVIGCCIAFIVLVNLAMAIFGVVKLDGFWRCTGIFFTFLIGGSVGGFIGMGIGTIIGKVKEEYEAFGMPIALAGILLGSLIMNAILGKWLFNFMLISALG